VLGSDVLNFIYVGTYCNNHQYAAYPAHHPSAPSAEVTCYYQMTI
jgi:hypothetical protein